MNNELKPQYCRYCARCMARDEDLYFCLNDEMNNPVKSLNNKDIRRLNKCKRFILNEIAVDDLERVYKPREKSLKIDNQISLFD